HGNEDVTIEFYIERQREVADFAEVIDTMFQFAG
ncbi:MAG: hypothetical protein K0S37_3764, partial [Microbacterium sp.]|nr:hypothetical protein [Microbacterium sp.]